MLLTIEAAVRQVHLHIDFLYQHNALSARAMRRVQAPRFEKAFARSVVRGRKPRLGDHEFSVARLRTLAGGDAESVLAVDRQLRPQDGLKAFIGHRFSHSVTPNLRHNLQLALRPYRISAFYADSDIPNGPLFDLLLKRIETSHFCIFDDRDTEARPNVFLELGAAIALRRPYFYLHYRQGRTMKVGQRRERMGVPSDLAGMLYLPYPTYEELCRELAMRLPGFLVDRNLAQEQADA